MAANNELLQAAIRAHSSGRSNEAAALYQQILGYSPRDPVALNNLGLLLGQRGEYARSEELLRRAVQLAPGDAGAYINLAIVLQEQERFDEAVGCSEQAVKLAPADKRAQNTLATALLGAQRYEQAVGLLERMLAARPGHAQGHQLLATACAKLGRLEQAVAAYGRAIKLSGRDVVSLVAAAECLLILGRPAEALQRLDQALRYSAYDVRGLALRTLALAELGRVDEEQRLSDPGRLLHKLTPSELGYAAGDVQRLNDGLRRFAAADPGMLPDPKQYASYNGWHSTRNLAESDDPAIAELKGLARAAFDRRLAALSAEDPGHPFVRAAPERYHLDLWSVRLRGGGKMLPHIHTSGWLSGVYYVDVPPIVDDPAAGGAGWIHFGTPRIDIKLSRTPLTHAVKPEPGLMITFPSYLWHDTVPLPPDYPEPRLIFSFDFQPATKARPGAAPGGAPR